jgi:transposase
MYAPRQAILLQPSVEELLPGNHLVRMVSKLIEYLDKRVLERQYKGGGTNAYDPQMLLKVIIYVCTQRCRVWK